ncbi:MAG: hypothetical protein ACKVZ0_18565 [Gemmatimonadales bacterium]
MSKPAMGLGRGLLWIGLAAVVGCERGDPRINDLTVGIPKDSAVAVMGGAPTVIEPYLINGLYIEAMFYARPGKTDSASKAPRKMTPVVAINGKLAGWGWVYWDSLAPANQIPVAPK